MGFCSDLEDYLIPLNKWNEDDSWRKVIPPDILVDLEACLTHTYRGPSIGLGKHPEKGWIIMCCGQGPFLAWSEKKEEAS